MNRDNINSLSSFTGASTSKNLVDIEDESTSPLKAKEPEKDQIESLTPDQAMELLNSPKLKSTSSTTSIPYSLQRSHS